MQLIKTILTTISLAVVVVGCTVRQQDLDAWVGVPVEALDTHPIFNTVPMDRTITDSGIEIRNYRNGPCNNIFYIKGRKVIKYAPTGRCYTYKDLQPHYLAEDRINDINKRQQFCDADNLNKTKKIDTVEAYKQFLLECNDPDNQYYKLANQSLSIKLMPKIEEPKIVEKNKVPVQTERPQTIIVPTGSLGEISEVRKKILEKTLESKLDDYFAIVPKDLFEEAQEQVFQEMESDECTEEQCIMMIREILQVENSFQLVLMVDEGDTQISLTWNDLDKKRVEEEYCEGCKTKELRQMIEGLVEKLVQGK